MEPLPESLPSQSPVTKAETEEQQQLVSITANEHCYAVMDSPHTLKRRCEEVQEQLHEAKRSLYNAERREGRVKATVSCLLSDLKQERLVS